MRGLSLVFSLTIAISIWWLGSLFFGAELVPLPSTVGSKLLQLLVQGATLKTIGITVARGVGGLGLALVLALITGIAAGSSPSTMKLLTPLVAALQSCPPILWITLLMVWVGTGSAVPIAVVFATVFPPLFANVAQGCLSIDRRLFDMANLYNVPRLRVLRKIILPGVVPYLLAGLSYAASASWKITAVAEFLGSSTGIGAKIYWSYRMLEIPELFAWASIVIILGVYLELGVISPLRNAASGAGNTKEAT